MSTLLDVRGLSKRFGPIAAVENITFKVDRGEILGFLGPNGAGKSTTMRMLAGYLLPSEGKASVCGLDVVNQPLAAQRHLGYLAEGAPIYGDMTPAEFLSFVASLQSLQGAKKSARLEKVRDQLELGSVWQRPIETLSKGYKRRVGLAQAIIADPDVLILDEPTDGLDPNQKRQVRALLRELQSEKAIIVSTHILEEVEAICTRAVVISEGRLVADASPNQLLQRSRYHNVVRLRLPDDRTGQARSLLEGINGISRIETAPTDDGLADVLAFPTGGQDILDEVKSAVADESLSIKEIYVDRGRLEDVFSDLTKAA